MSLSKHKANVSIARMGLYIEVRDVDADDASTVAADLLDEVRALVSVFPELRECPDTVPGGHPIEYNDDDWSDEGRRQIGFKSPAVRGRNS